VGRGRFGNFSPWRFPEFVLCHGGLSRAAAVVMGWVRGCPSHFWKEFGLGRGGCSFRRGVGE
jgi:hypothetical protein